MADGAVIDGAWRASLPLLLCMRIEIRLFQMESELYLPLFLKDKLAIRGLLDVKPSFSAQILPNQLQIGIFPTGSQWAFR